MGDRLDTKGAPETLLLLHRIASLSSTSLSGVPGSLQLLHVGIAMVVMLWYTFSLHLSRPQNYPHSKVRVVMSMPKNATYDVMIIFLFVFLLEHPLKEADDR